MGEQPESTVLLRKPLRLPSIGSPGREGRFGPRRTVCRQVRGSGGPFAVWRMSISSMPISDDQNKSLDFPRSRLCLASRILDKTHLVDISPRVAMYSRAVGRRQDSGRLHRHEELELSVFGNCTRTPVRLMRRDIPQHEGMASTSFLETILKKPHVSCEYITIALCDSTYTAHKTDIAIICL